MKIFYLQNTVIIKEESYFQTHQSMDCAHLTLQLGGKWKVISLVYACWVRRIHLEAARSRYVQECTEIIKLWPALSHLRVTIRFSETRLTSFIIIGADRAAAVVSLTKALGAGCYLHDARIPQALKLRVSRLVQTDDGQDLPILYEAVAQVKLPRRM